MEFHKKLPEQALSDYIKCYWYFEVKEEDLPVSQLYFPYGSFELIHFANECPEMLFVGDTAPFLQPSLFYSGQFTKAFYLTYDKPCRCVGVSFHPWAGHLLCKTPPAQFTNTMIHLNDFEKNGKLNDELKSCKTKEEYYYALENYVIEKIESVQIDMVSAHIAKEIMKSPTRKNTNIVLNDVGLSRRRIEQRFLASTGLSLGLFTRKIRFQKSIGLLKSGENDKNLTQIGLQAGYYDQSHFISEFKDFTSIPPGVFLEQKHELKNFLKSLTATD